MRAALGPLHLLLLTEALTDHLVDRRFEKAGADALTTAIALAIGGDEGAIALNIRVELFYGFEELAGRGIACDGHCPVHVHGEDSNLMERFIDVAMPQRPFEALQL